MESFINLLESIISNIKPYQMSEDFKSKLKHTFIADYLLIESDEHFTEEDISNVMNKVNNEKTKHILSILKTAKFKYLNELLEMFSEEAFNDYGVFTTDEFGARKIVNLCLGNYFNTKNIRDKNNKIMFASNGQIVVLLRNLHSSDQTVLGVIKKEDFFNVWQSIFK